MDAPATAETILSPVEPSDRSDDQNPSPPARNGSSGSPGSPGAPVAINGHPHVNSNGAGEGTQQINGAASPTGDIEANGNGQHIGYTLAAWALVSYGSVQRLGQRRGGEGNGLPTGEPHPPADFWIERYLKASSEDRPRIAEQAAAELQAWKRRAPELAQIKTETLDDLKRRILRDGEGWEAKDVALACRCTPTLVRRVRSEAERSADDGRPEGGLAHGLQLLRDGCSLRQAAMSTGIPKSTLHDAYKASVA